MTPGSCHFTKDSHPSSDDADAVSSGRDVLGGRLGADDGWLHEASNWSPGTRRSDAAGSFSHALWNGMKRSL